MQRKLLYAREDLSTNDLAKTNCDSSRKKTADDSTNDATNAHQQHPTANAPDVASIALHYAIIDNICHHLWQIEIRHGLRKGHHEHSYDLQSIRFHESHQSNHAFSSPFHKEAYILASLSLK